jgi:Zn-dependent peptidase ImmA (M78 family)/transcriptional regulator with XRE-family HTH domain
MPVSTVELGRRLRAAREQVGLKQEDAARALSLSRAAVAQLELGDRSPNSLQLARLAELYGQDVAEFLHPDSFRPEGNLSVIFRANPAFNEDDERQEAVRNCARLAHEYDGLESLLELGGDRVVPAAYDLPVPENKWDAIRQGDSVADLERGRLKLGDGPIRDFVELLESQDVRAFQLELPEDISGLFLTDGGKGMSVIVAAGEALVRQRFSYAHEYCHLLLDRRRMGLVSSVSNREDLFEVRANAFAASFLLPEGGVRNALRAVGKAGATRSVLTASFDGSNPVEGQKRVPAQAIQLYDVVHLAKAYGVSYEMTLFRLLNLRLLSEEERQVLASQRSVANAIRPLFGGEVTTESRERGAAQRAWRNDSRHRFMHLALECVRRELISRRKFAELCDLAGVDSEEADALLAAIAGGDAEGRPSDNDQPKGRAREYRG